MATVTVWSDLACPWACLAVHRLWTTRERLGLVGDVEFDHRVFALEVVNSRPSPRKALDAEIAVIATLVPETRWRPWSRSDWTYPVSTLLAMEAVQAVKAQGLAASAALDLALRHALFADSRCITMRHVILDIATECDEVDVPALERALDSGAARSAVMQQHREAVDGPVAGSPHVFVGDTGWHNPGVEQHWDKELRAPAIESDQPAVYDEILRGAVA